MKRTILIAMLLLQPAAGALGHGHPADAASPGNEAPLADAGLDQTVTTGTQVFLDATGSRDPDGRIESYEWSITTPGGTAVAPACRTCGRTTFRPERTGTYDVTVTVTDDDGAESTDTLYVTVRNGSGPRISLSSPGPSRTGERVQYVAEAHAGDAPLRSIRWTVDGTAEGNRSATGESATVSLGRTFGSDGVHTVTAVVVDRRGRVARQSVSTLVLPREDDNSTDPGSGGGSGRPPDVTPPPATNGSEPPAAERIVFSIEGDQLVTGESPFRRDYRISTASPSQPGDDVARATEVPDVSTIRWFKTGSAGHEFLGEGSDTTVEWFGGDHELYAVIVYDDGSTEVATFADGTNDVVVDPRPEASVDVRGDDGSLEGQLIATDTYDNLRSIRVLVDGERVETWGPLGVGSDGTGRRDVNFSMDGVDLTAEHNVTVVATDARGQRRVRSTSGTFAGLPEIVQSGFVTSDHDSYHPRLDPERYAAHHVLKVDLNGAGPEQVSVDRNFNSMRRLNSNHYRSSRRYYSNNNTLVIHSYWASNEPGQFRLESYATVEAGGQQYQIGKDQIDHLVVSPSDPVLDLSIEKDGTPQSVDNWGITVDASRSFDPDGTKLEFIWERGAEPINDAETRAKFDAFSRATLILKDQFHRVTKQSFGFLRWFNPDIRKIEPVTEGPYLPNETVRFRVSTNSYDLPKSYHYDEFTVALEPSSGRVVEWKQVEADWRNENNAQGPDVSERDAKVYVGMIAIEASAFATRWNPPVVRTYNQKQPEKTVQVVPIEGVNVLQKGSRVYTNLKVEDTSYVVERERTRRVKARTEAERESYARDGYEFVSRVYGGAVYEIEKRTLVQEAKYETREREFSTHHQRRQFLMVNDQWEAAGVKTTQRTVRTTDVEWRSTRSGDGRYTGQTRRKLVRPAKYRYENEYRYQVLGGYETYWASRKLVPQHEPTGQTRTKKVQDAVYERQYRYELARTKQVVERRYIATNRVKVRKAEYEWRVTGNMTNRRAVRMYTRNNPQYRIGTVNPKSAWLMEKDGVTYTVTRDTARNRNRVLETNAEITGTINQTYLNLETGEKRSKRVRSFERSLTLTGFATAEDVIRHVNQETGNPTPCVPPGDVRRDLNLECPL